VTHREWSGETWCNG